MSRGPRCQTDLAKLSRLVLILLMSGPENWQRQLTACGFIRHLKSYPPDHQWTERPTCLPALLAACSERQREVALLILEGYGNVAIARKLGLTSGRVGQLRQVIGQQASRLEAEEIFCRVFEGVAVKMKRYASRKP